MTQNTFNQFITIGLLAFFMAMYALSWATGRALDWTQLFSFTIPAVVHTINLVLSAQVQTTNAKVNADVTVAKITKNGVTS